MYAIYNEKCKQHPYVTQLKICSKSHFKINLLKISLKRYWVAYVAQLQHSNGVNTKAIKQPICKFTTRKYCGVSPYFNHYLHVISVITSNLHAR